MPFPESWPVYLTKDMVATWMELYTFSMEINVWTETAFLGASYDEGAALWHAQVRRDDGTIRAMRPKHYWLATGVDGALRFPESSGLDRFAGYVAHSSQFDSGMDV